MFESWDIAALNSFGTSAPFWPNSEVHWSDDNDALSVNSPSCNLTKDTLHQRLYGSCAVSVSPRCCRNSRTRAVAVPSVGTTFPLPMMAVHRDGLADPNGGRDLVKRNARHSCLGSQNTNCSRSRTSTRAYWGCELSS